MCTHKKGKAEHKKIQSRVDKKEAQDRMRVRARSCVTRCCCFWKCPRWDIPGDRLLNFMIWDVIAFLVPTAFFLCVQFIYGPNDIF